MRKSNKTVPLMVPAASSTTSVFAWGPWAENLNLWFPPTKFVGTRIDWSATKVWKFAKKSVSPSLTLTFSIFLLNLCSEEGWAFAKRNTDKSSTTENAFIMIVDANPIDNYSFYFYQLPIRYNTTSTMKLLLNQMKTKSEIFESKKSMLLFPPKFWPHFFLSNLTNLTHTN